MNVVIKVNDEIKEKMIEYYKDKKRDKVIPYVVFQAQEEDTVITMYESGKVMFQGTSADVDAAMELLPLTYKDLTNVNDLPAKYKSIEGANFVDYNTVFGLRKSGLINGLICKTIKAQTALLASSPAFREGTEVTSEEAANLAADVLKFVGGVSGMDPNGHLWYMQKAEIDGLGSGANPKEIIWRGNKNKGTEDYAFGLNQEVQN